MSTANTAPPASYTALPFKDIQVSHVPADSPTPTKVLMVAFNRPDKHNAVTGRLLDELEAVYRLIDQDERVRAIVLTGNGKAFCAGADLQVGFTGLLAHKESEETISQFRDPGGRAALVITHCTKPTIVAINGPAAGVGITLTLPAAIRVAWRDAKVSFPFARRGLTLESTSAFFLPRLVGLRRATHLATTGGAYAAADPLVRPLFSALLATPAETVAHAVALATDVAENTSLTSTRMMRDMMVYCPATPDETHVLDSRVFLSVVGTGHNVEGIRSFMEKRPARFAGRLETEAVPFWPWWTTAEGEAAAAKEGKKDVAKI